MKKLLTIPILLFAHFCMQAQSPYISKVYDFVPAPGQFVNELPEYESGDTKADMIKKVEECLVDNEQVMVSLGGYGGYIIFGFDHLVNNVSGKYDFRILGNAYYAANTLAEGQRVGGSCEPGIVMVAYDENGNGLPDDTWYELAGSEYRKTETIKNYRITYNKPDASKVPTPNLPYLTDSTYIKWTSNQGDYGYIAKNSFHTQSYYPLWISDPVLEFEGTKLANNYVDISGNGSSYLGYAYQWGYADNHPNSDGRSGFNIEWAVDSDGNKVDLPGIHFVKVYTGINQYNGWVGEVSTEIMGAEDLHLTGNDTNVPVFVESISLDYTTLKIKPGDNHRLKATLFPADATNSKIVWKTSNSSVVEVEEGMLTAIAEGKAEIQAISSDGHYIATCQVEVTKTNDLNDTEEVKRGFDYVAGSIHLLNMKDYSCLICDLRGQVVLSIDAESDNESHILNLSPGIYLFNATNGSEMIAKKMLVASK